MRRKNYSKIKIPAKHFVFGAFAGEEPVLSTTRVKGGLLTNPSRGQNELFAGKVSVSKKEILLEVLC